jgi:hypothetical protein
MVGVPSQPTWKWLIGIVAAIIIAVSVGYYNRNLAFADKLCCTDYEITQKQIRDEGSIELLLRQSISQIDEEREYRARVEQTLDRIERKVDRLR